MRIATVNSVQAAAPAQVRRPFQDADKQNHATGTFRVSSRFRLTIPPFPHGIHVVAAGQLHGRCWRKKDTPGAQRFLLHGRRPLPLPEPRMSTQMRHDPGLRLTPPSMHDNVYTWQ